jgi:SAM-dependent methyltransferase
VRDRQRGYLPVLAARAPVLDVGCGRGEFLDLLAEAGISASGVDSDAGMVQRCLNKGHDVREGDLNDHLAGLADRSLGAIFSAQVIEHLPYDALRRLLALGHEKLAPGGRLIAETVNPHAPDALKAFWVDPTHQHPVFPEVALALARIAGFPSAFVFHPMGSGDVERDRLVESAYALVATTAS